MNELINCQKDALTTKKFKTYAGITSQLMAQKSFKYNQVQSNFVRNFGFNEKDSKSKTKIPI